MVNDQVLEAAAPIRNDPDQRAVNWLVAVRALGGGFEGIAWATALDEFAAEACSGDLIEALAIQLIEDCDLAGVTYFHDGAFYFMPRWE